jgi:hypothetical protein
MLETHTTAPPSRITDVPARTVRITPVRSISRRCCHSPSEPIGRLLARTQQLITIADIRADDDRLSTDLLDRPQRFLRIMWVTVEAADRHADAGPREGDRHRLADTARRACDERT